MDKMSCYYSQFYNRRSIRLPGYDYSKPGFYFITICCQDRQHFLGEIKDAEMHLNEAGKMIEKWYFKLEEKFSEIKCHEMVVMPNHFHCIIEIITAKNNTEKKGWGDHAPTHDDTDMGDHVGSPRPAGLATVIGWFKTMTTNEYIRGVKQLGWRKFNKRFWQRNYFEIIIRSEKSYQRITQYIKNNPIKWGQDNFRRK
jgi:REP element-mobilizing transposase RayT